MDINEWREMAEDKTSAGEHAIEILRAGGFDDEFVTKIGKRIYNKANEKPVTHHKHLVKGVLVKVKQIPATKPYVHQIKCPWEIDAQHAIIRLVEEGNPRYFLVENRDGLTAVTLGNNFSTFGVSYLEDYAPGRWVELTEESIIENAELTKEKGIYLSPIRGFASSASLSTISVSGYSANVFIYSL